MNIEWNWRKVALVSSIAGALIVTNVGQYFVIWKPHDNDIKTKYLQQIATLQGTLDEIGPLTPVWVVKQGNNDIFPGKEIKQDDLEIKQLPQSFINEGYVLDPSEVIGKYFKLSLGPGTPVLQELVMDEPMDDTVREFDVVSSTLPIGLKVGDYIDFRLVYPLGEDYIVLSHKRVEAINGKTIKLHLNETEIHLYQAAIVDYYLQAQKGSMVYLAKYVEPGAQEPAKKYYAVPKNILAIMTADPNIIEKVNSAINSNTRTIIDHGISSVSQEDGAAINAGRNDVKSKVEQGETENQNNIKAQKEAEEQAKLQQQQTTIQSTPPPASNPPAANTNTTPQDSSSLNVGKGVVE